MASPATLPGSIVTGTYHGTPYMGRVTSTDAYGWVYIDTPGLTHMDRPYDSISTNLRGSDLMVKIPRTTGRIDFANEVWSWKA